MCPEPGTCVTHHRSPGMERKHGARARELFLCTHLIRYVLLYTRVLDTEIEDAVEGWSEEKI